MTPEEARAELVRRLEEGDYKQGKHALKVVYPDGHEEHCCLGVAGEIAVEEGLCEWTPFKGYVDNFEAEQLIEEEGVEVLALAPRPEDRPYARYDILPGVVADFFGFKTKTGMYGEDDSDSLASDNDGGVPFDVIAETIRTEKSLLS